MRICPMRNSGPQRSNRLIITWVANALPPLEAIAFEACSRNHWRRGDPRRRTTLSAGAAAQHVARRRAKQSLHLCVCGWKSFETS